jgi:DUF1680 family protein
MTKFVIMKILPLLLFVTLLMACTSGSTKKDTAKSDPLDYSLPAEAYLTRLKASDPSRWKPLSCPVTIPSGGIVLPDNSLFRTAMDRNIAYLLNSFSVDHMLVPFRIRAGEENPPDDRPQVGFWDTDLRGSNAGRFMMGAGNTLRWIKNEELQNRLNKLIDGIEACREPNGYILAYPPDSARSEEPNYGRAWFTHGLIEAAISGNPKAYELLRGHADWFNQWDVMLPKLLYWNNNSHQGHIASTRTYFSPVGKPEDLQVAEKYYVCDWWMDELAAHHEEAIWRYPLQNPHSYLITSFEAYLDHYIATGDRTYLEAMLGAWDMIHENWEHTGGSMAICESQWTIENGKRVLSHHAEGHPPHSYFLTSEGHTGETCGSVFWIKFNQRFHRLFPDEEKYVSEIEKSIYNVCLANQMPDGKIRYHAVMQGKKEAPGESYNTCCEGQGTRLLGSLPEYIYSIAPDGLYVNLYEPSSISCPVKGKQINLTMESEFPYKPEVSIAVTTPSPIRMKLRIRTPLWATQPMALFVNGKQLASGRPGSYTALSRKWETGDRITFALPMDIRVTPYRGADEVPGSKRYAVEYGPVLLALTGSQEIPAHIRPSHSSGLKDRIGPETSHPLHFSVDDDSLSFVP